MTRLKDIALRAGVSVMTVSKALRDEPDVSEATKARLKLLAQHFQLIDCRRPMNIRCNKQRKSSFAFQMVCQLCRECCFS